VIGLSTLPLIDDNTIFKSVRKTDCLIIVDESPLRYSFATDISDRGFEPIFGEIKMAIKKITLFYSPVSFSPLLQKNIHSFGAKNYLSL